MIVPSTGIEMLGFVDSYTRTCAKGTIECAGNRNLDVASPSTEQDIMLKLLIGIGSIRHGNIDGSASIRICNTLDALPAKRFAPCCRVEYVKIDEPPEAVLDTGIGERPNRFL